MAAANDTYELVNFFESTNTSYEVNAGNTKASDKLEGLGPEPGEGQSPSADRGENDPNHPIGAKK